MGARVGLILLLALASSAILVRLSGMPPALAATNRVPSAGIVAVAASHTSGCQSEETLPAGASAIRLWLGVEVGPAVEVAAFLGSRVITRGRHGAGWTGTTLTIPVRRVPRTIAGTRLCFAFGGGGRKIWLIGGQTTAGGGGLLGASRPGSGTRGPSKAQPFKMRVEYLRPGDASWFSRALSTARHMSLGRTPPHTWAVLIPAALLAMAILLTA
jgi:hypothetical protein